MYQEPINITKQVEEYLELNEEIIALNDMGNASKAGLLSQDLTKMHSAMASRIFFYKEDSSAARNVMAQFLKNAKYHRSLFPRKFNGDAIDNAQESIRCKCFIYNDPEEGNVKLCIQNGPDNVIFKIENHYEDGKLSDVEGEEPRICFSLDRFRDASDDSNSIPFNRTAENFVRGRGLVPAYWTDGNVHANHWFMDGITREEAGRLLKTGPGGNKGGKYDYIAYSLMGEKKEDKGKKIIEMMERMNKVVL